MKNSVLCSFANLYRSSSQLQDNSETFINNVELDTETLSQKNCSHLVIIGDLMQNQRFGTAMITLTPRERH